MRPAWFAPLLLFWVTAVAVHAQQTPMGDSAPARRIPSVAKKQPKARPLTPTERGKEAEAIELAQTVVGTWQKTKDDAERDALEKAQETLLFYLQKREPSVLWRPDLEYIRKNLVKGTDFESKEFDDPNVGLMQRASLEIQVSRRDRDAMLRQDRDHKQELVDRFRAHVAEQRLHRLSKVFGALVALLAGAAGYIRLDELTKGYYTNWLRLAAASFVGAAGAGLWFLA